jgi:hypothetical protein
MFKRKKSRFFSSSVNHDNISQEPSKFEWLESGNIPSKEELEEQNTIAERIHKFYKGGEVNPNDPPLVDISEPGFRYELGGSGDVGIDLELEEQVNHSPYYKEYFSEHAHHNFIGGDGSNPIVISAKMEDEKKKKSHLWRIIVWSKKESYFIKLWAGSKQKMLKKIKILGAELLGQIEFLEVKDQKFVEELVHVEDRLLIKAYKFGVVYCKEGQTDENEMFSNNENSECFNEFLDSVADKVVLKGFTQYKGGLNTADDSTGEYSYFTTFKGFEIMFHVSTYLPFTENNPQQVERKRQIGNDVVVIVFQDGPTGAGFSPKTITSKFNHVYAIVQPETPGATGPDVVYKFGLISKEGVKVHCPVLPINPVLYHKGDEFREFLLTKLINSERAAYYAPGFSQSRTRRLWLKDFLDKYSPTAEKVH